MKPWIWKLTLSDGKNTLEFEGIAKWLYGGDYDVEFDVVGYVDAETGSVLDGWEENKAQLDVSVELERCRNGDVPVECDEDTRDYYSQQGKATIEWEVGERVSILLKFQGEQQ